MVFAIARVAVADGGREKEEGEQNLDHCATRRPGRFGGAELLRGALIGRNRLRPRGEARPPALVHGLN